MQGKRSNDTRNSKINEYLNRLKEDIDKIPNKKLEKIASILKNSETIYIAGNGGSSSTASHIVNDLQKICGLRAFCLTDNVPLLTAWSNDDCFENVFENQLSVSAKEKDTLVVLSGSGESGNLIEAVKWAISNKMNVITILGDSDSTLNRFENTTSICVDTDMQHAEDIHLILGHILLKLIGEK
jgi:D-sedoheptulose 7-phosphate isomerase